MTIDLTPSKRQHEIREAIHGLAVAVIRPACLGWDRDHGVPEAFLRNLALLAGGTGSLALLEREAQGNNVAPEGAAASGDKSERSERRKSSTNVTTIIAAEEMAWGDAGLLLCLPGPGLGAPPIRASGTPEQKERFFGIFKDMSTQLKW